MSVRRQTQAGYEFVALENQSAGKREYNEIYAFGLQASVRMHVRCSKSAIHAQSVAQPLKPASKIDPIVCPVCERAVLQAQVGAEAILVIIVSL